MSSRLTSRIASLLATTLFAAACGGTAAPSPSVAPTVAATAQPTAAPTKAPATYSKIGNIDLPTQSASFDVFLIDTKTHTLYLADRTSKGVDVIVNEKFVRTIGGMVGVGKSSKLSGPNGLVLVPDLNQLWVGDGDSTVKVVDLGSNAVIATIPTGGKNRVDEGAYDPKDKIVMIANDAEDPPFVTFFSTSDRKIIGKLDFPGADGLEESIWDDANGVFWLSVPKTKANPGGSVVAIDPKTMKVTKTFVEKDCESNGIAPGPKDVLLLVCNGDAIADGFKASTQLMDLKTGSIIGSVPVGGGDLAAYNPSDGHYYVADSNMTSDGTKAGTATPVLLIIDAASFKVLQTIPTAKSAHALVVDTTNSHIYVPIPDKGIAIFATQ